MHAPASQPAVVQGLPSVSAQTVLSDLGDWMHVWVASHAAVLHSFNAVHGVVACVWTHAPASQPAVVQLLPSVSVQAVLSCLGDWMQVWVASHAAVLHSFNAV